MFSYNCYAFFGRWLIPQVTFRVEKNKYFFREIGNKFVKCIILASGLSVIIYIFVFVEALIVYHIKNETTFTNHRIIICAY